MMRVSGLPIAAYMGALVALALASAFVAVLAIVLLLPPRPPDVMRADDIAEHFQAGYDYASVEGRPLPGDNMAWSIQRDAPELEHESQQMAQTRADLAMQLGLTPEQVHLAAEKIVSNDVFVFQVQGVDELRREALEGLREALVEAEENRRDAERSASEAEAAIRAAEDAVRDAHGASDNQRQEALQMREEARQAAVAAAHEARVLQEHAREIERRVRAETQRIMVITSSQTGTEVSVDVSAAPTPPTPPAVAAPQIGAVAPTPPVIAPAPRVEAPAPHARVVVPAPPMPPMFAPAPAGVVLIAGFTVAAELPDGRWLVMRQGRNWAEIGWILRTAGVIGGTLLALSLLALLFARRLTRPIRAFSEAVQAVGVNPQSEPVREEGPLELRGAARAVNTMQARLRSLIADRTKTLAAVAHDMRTPLMRLRLAAENAPAEQRERMAKDIAEVEALVASFIAFARDDPAEEARVRLDLSALLQSIADDHVEAGRNVSFEGEERAVITGQSLGLKRLFANLVENALKYGDSARIVMRKEGGGVVVDVEDDGPGVPPEQRESVFEPFVRLNGDENKSGAGLGLPAARSIARAHGGDVVILDAAKGALVRVTLPG
ncbi:MAG: HAMP domain-containing protein [Hyphomonadaceae bacterium]|nr:HAMP domain-containing protein [Hyphomonadaceae bacterium]